MVARTTPRSRSSRLLLVVTALALLASACHIVASPTPPRPWYCDPTDTAINDGHGTTFFLVYTQEKGPLSDADCSALKDLLIAAEAFAKQYPTVADAEAGGFSEAAVWSPGQGIHYADLSRIGSFDPTRPNWLMYDGTDPDSQLTGMMFGASSGTYPPAGFPGANDHWHYHHELCVRTTGSFYVLGEHLSDAECTALGGVNQSFMSYWMVHVWLPPYDGWLATDIFNMMHPSLP